MKNLVTITILSFFASSGVKGQLLASQFSDGGCTFPAPAANATKILVTYATPQVYTAYYVSKSYAINYAKVFLGHDPANWTEVNGLCYNLAFSEGLAIQTGYGGSRTWIDTALPQINVTYPGGLFSYSTDIRVTPGVNTAPRVTFTQNAVWSDGTNVLTVNCVLNQTQDWSLFSANGPPPQSVKDLVLEIVAFQLHMDVSHAYDFTPYCPNPPSFFEYILKALKNVGILPIGYIPILSGLLGNVGVVYIAALQSLYDILGIVVFPLIPNIGG